MYEKFTDDARKVMQLANQEAQRFRHEYIGTETILLGLMSVGNSVACKVLQSLDVDAGKINREVWKIIQAGPVGNLPANKGQTPRAKKVIEYAIEEARSLKHDYVGTEHLLLGLVREGEGVAGQVLVHLGLTLAKLRQEVLNVLGLQEGLANEPKPLRLTQFAKRAGCAAKQPPGYLLPLLSQLPAVTDPNVLVGSSTADDAAIYKLNDDLALVLTTDFFTPIVDKPYDFGAVAAANALSDVYAMGGKPLTALNIVGFPDDAKLPVAVLAEILRGAADKAAEAGIAIVGGHSIKAEEPIFGLAVVGTIHPRKVLANAGAKPGDVLVLTKPLGLGIISTAAKNNEDRLGAIAEAIKVMTTLNRAAAEVLERFEVHALTDITGFGLLGHLRNMTSASAVTARVWAESVPVLAAAREYVQAGIAPGGTHANWRFLADWVTYGADVSKEQQLLLCDAQTSGGLLASIPATAAEAVVAALRQAGTLAAAVIGRIEAPGTGKISVSLANSR
jgi:selenide,water dikinase